MSKSDVHSQLFVYPFVLSELQPIIKRDNFQGRVKIGKSIYKLVRQRYGMLTRQLANHSIEALSVDRGQ